jgi:hypothetical protein
MSTQINRVSDIACNQLVNRPKAKTQLNNRTKAINPMHFNELIANVKKTGYPEGTNPSGSKSPSGQGINPMFFESVSRPKSNSRPIEPAGAREINPIHFEGANDAQLLRAE